MVTFSSLITLQSQTPVFLSDFLALYDTDIQATITKQFHEEDVRNTSEMGHDHIAYWYAYTYMCCIYWYYTKNNLSGTEGWATIKAEFNWDTMLEKFSCRNINLWDVMNIIGLPDFITVNPGVLIYTPIGTSTLGGTLKVEYFTESANGIGGDQHTLSHTPIGDTSNLLVELNGVGLLSSQYTKSGSDITISIHVYQGDQVMVLYKY